MLEAINSISKIPFLGFLSWKVSAWHFRKSTEVIVYKFWSWSKLNLLGNCCCRLSFEPIGNKKPSFVHLCLKWMTHWFKNYYNLYYFITKPPDLPAGLFFMRKSYSTREIRQWNCLKVCRYLKRIENRFPLNAVQEWWKMNRDIEKWRQKRSSLQNKWFGCEVAHAVKEKTRYKPLMVHTQCPGTADRLFNNHRLSVSLFLIFSAHLPTVSQSASLSLSLHRSQLSSKFANLVWISHFPPPACINQYYVLLNVPSSLFHLTKEHLCRFLG